MSVEKMNSKIVPALCTQCGAKIEVDPLQDAAICPHCGTAFIVEKAVRNFIIQGAHSTNVEHIDTVNINTVPQGNAGSALYFLDRFLDRRNRRIMEKERLAIEKERIQLLRLENEERQKEREYERQGSSVIFRFVKFVFFGIFKVIFWVIAGIVILYILLS